MLNRGDMGADVAAWQTFLRARGYCAPNGALIAVSSDYDSDTEYATMRFQRDNGLAQTGVLCPATELVARRLGWHVS